MAVALTPRVRIITHDEIAKAGAFFAEAADLVRKGLVIHAPDLAFACNVLLELGMSEDEVADRVLLLTGERPVVKHLPGRHDQSSHGRRGTASALFRRGRAGGFTFSVNRRRYPATGYAVAVPGNSLITPASSFTPEALVDYLDTHSAKFSASPQLHLGGWYDSAHDEMVLDLVEVFDNQDEAVQAGISRDEQAIFDLANGIEIPTGGTGGREEVAKHGGPGPHDNGSPQRVHGGGSAGAGGFVGKVYRDVILAKHTALADADTLAKVNEVLQSNAPRLGVFTRVNSYILEKILDTGRFKSQHESGSSNGAFNPRLRAQVELALHGVNVTKDPYSATIYGYLTEDPYGHAGAAAMQNADDWNAPLDLVGQYGDIAVKFKDSVRERTTLTFGDSLDDTGILSAVSTGVVTTDLSTGEVTINNPSMAGAFLHTSPTPLTSPTHVAVPDYQHPRIQAAGGPVNLEDHAGGFGGYLEAQMHGGVTLSDIEHVYVNEDTPSSVLMLLQARNIPYTILYVTSEEDEDGMTHLTVTETP